jgi:hypothetical protein
LIIFIFYQTYPEVRRRRFRDFRDQLIRQTAKPVIADASFAGLLFRMLNLSGNGNLYLKKS